MMKKLAFACTSLLVLAACSNAPEPQPRPDPALVERIALANSADPETPKLAKADKIAGAVANVEPDRVASAAESLLAR